MKTDNLDESSWIWWFNSTETCCTLVWFRHWANKQRVKWYIQHPCLHVNASEDAESPVCSSDELPGKYDTLQTTMEYWYISKLPYELETD